MLIGYGQPTGVGWTLAGVGVVWMGEGTPDALNDGKPSRSARLHWLTSAPALASCVTLTATWPVATSIRVIALLGLSVPAGTKIEIRGKRVGDAGPTFALGGNALTQRTVALPSGSVCAWFVVDAANPPLVGLEIRIFNDVSGAVVLDAGSYVDIGEAVFMPAVDADLASDWRRTPIDPSVVSRTIGAQLNVVSRKSYRRLAVGLTPASVSTARNGALANGMDWESLEALLLASQRCVAIPRWRAAGSGAIDSNELHRTAVYGVATPAGYQHLGGDYYDSTLTFDEIPA